MSREGDASWLIFVFMQAVYLILKLFFLFRRFLLCSTSLVVSHTLRKCCLLKYPFDKIIHKVLGIIIRNFGVWRVA